MSFEQPYGIPYEASQGKLTTSDSGLDHGAQMKKDAVANLNMLSFALALVYLRETVGSLVEDELVGSDE